MGHINFFHDNGKNCLNVIKRLLFNNVVLIQTF